MKRFTDFLHKYRKMAISSYMNLSIFWKNFIIFLSVSLLPLLALGIFSWNLASQNVYNEVINRNAEYFQQNTYRVNEAIDQVNLLINTVATNPVVSDTLTQDYTSIFSLYSQLEYYLRPYMSMINTFNNQINHIYLFTDNKSLPWKGYIICHIDYLNKCHTADGLKSYFGPLWQYKPPLLEQGDNRPRLICSQSVAKLVNIKAKNFCAAEIFPECLFSSLSPGPERGCFIICDENKQIIYTKAGEQNKISASQLQSILQQPEPSSLNGKLYYFSSELHIPGYRIYMIFSPDNIFLSQSAILVVTVVLFVFSLLITTLFTLQAAKTSSKRLHNFSKQAELLSSSCQEVCLTVDYQDEIGNLILIFNRMLRNIRTLAAQMQQQELENMQLEMKALHAQINPHLLYNLFSLINSQALKKRQYDISDLTVRISMFYRQMLNCNDTVIPISREIENLKSYIAIQLMLKSNSFDVVYHIDDTILNCEMPNIILQPLVENALEHGILDKEGARGKISLTVHGSTDQVIFEILDNGTGIDLAKTQYILTHETKNYGLHNIQQRIRFLYGDEYGISIDSEPGQFTKVTVHIPRLPYNTDRSGSMIRHT